MVASARSRESVTGASEPGSSSAERRSNSEREIPRRAAIASSRRTSSGDNRNQTGS